MSCFNKHQEIYSQVDFSRVSTIDALYNQQTLMAKHKKGDPALFGADYNILLYMPYSGERLLHLLAAYVKQEFMLKSNQNVGKILQVRGCYIVRIVNVVIYIPTEAHSGMAIRHLLPDNTVVIKDMHLLMYRIRAILQTGYFRITMRAKKGALPL